MIITRWQAELTPTAQDLNRILLAEGVEPFQETIEPGLELKDVRIPFDEIRIIAEGELLIDVAGNKLLLREGDRILIPANTRQSKKNQGSKRCVCICGHKL